MGGVVRYLEIEGLLAFGLLRHPIVRPPGYAENPLRSVGQVILETSLPVASRPIARIETVAFRPDLAKVPLAEVRCLVRRVMLLDDFRQRKFPFRQGINVLGRDYLVAHIQPAAVTSANVGKVQCGGAAPGQ